MQLKALTGAILLASAALMPCAAAAQSADHWQFGAQLYGYFPSLEGTTNFPASGSTPEVSLDPDDILEDLEGVFMGSFEAKRGRWGAFTDVMYLDLGDGQSDTRDFSVGRIQVPGTATGNVEYNLKGWIWTIAGEYEVVSQPQATLDVFVGARMVDIEQEVQWNLVGNIGSIPAPGRSGSSSVSGTTWDAIVGMKGRWRFGTDNRWFVPYYLDVGTGDSDFTWQAMAGLGYSWKSIDLYAAWRYLDYDVGEGEPFSELSLNGPLLAVGVRW
jgi:hypothetical protein